MMGHDGGFDDNDSHGPQRGSADAGPPPPSVQDAMSSVPGASAVIDSARAPTFTQRAIAYLYKDLKQGPRDGAARLDALKARVRKRIHAPRDSGGHQDAPLADDEANAEARSQAKRVRHIDDHHANIESKGSTSSGSRDAWCAAPPAEQIQPSAAVTGDKRVLDDGAQSSSYKRMKMEDSGGGRARPTSAKAPVGGACRRHDAGLQPPATGSRKSRRINVSGRSDRGSPGSSDDQLSAEVPARQRIVAEETPQGGTHQWLGRPPADGDEFSRDLQSER